MIVIATCLAPLLFSLLLSSNNFLLHLCGIVGQVIISLSPSPAVCSFSFMTHIGVAPLPFLQNIFNMTTRSLDYERALLSVDKWIVDLFITPSIIAVYTVALNNYSSKLLRAYRK